MAPDSFLLPSSQVSRRQPFPQGKAYAWLAVTTVLFGVSWVAAKWLTYELAPFTTSALRMAIAAVVLVLVMANRERASFRFPPREIPLMLFLSVTGAVLPNILFFWGMKFTTAVNGSLISSGIPVATAILSALILKEKITKRIVIGIGLTLVGVTYIVSGNYLDRLLSLNFNLGDLLILASVFSIALNTVYSKPALARFSPLTLATYTIVIGAVLSLPTLIPEWSPNPFQSMTARGWLSLAFLSVMVSGLAYVGWAIAVKHLGPTRTTIFANLIPLWTIVSASLLLGEQLLASHIIGGLLLLGGVYLASVREWNS